MFKNVAAKFMVFAFDSTTNLPKTGDAANITAYVSKDYGSVTVLGDTSAAEMDASNGKGYYLFDAAQGETNADCLMVSAKSSTANIVVVGAPAVIFTRPTTGWLAPATAGRTLVVDAAGLADANVVKIGPTGSGTAQTARDIGANVLLSSGTGTGQVKLASGYVAMTWADIAAPTTAVDLSGTTIAVTQKVDLNTIKTQAVTAAAGVTFPAALASTTNITQASGVTLSATGSAALTEDYAADGATMTLNQAIYQIWSLLAESNLSGTTITTLGLNGATAKMTFTVDSGVAPTTITRAT